MLQFESLANILHFILSSLPTYNRILWLGCIVLWVFRSCVTSCTCQFNNIKNSSLPWKVFPCAVSLSLTSSSCQPLITSRPRVCLSRTLQKGSPGKCSLLGLTVFTWQHLLKILGSRTSQWFPPPTAERWPVPDAQHGFWPTHWSKAVWAVSSYWLLLVRLLSVFVYKSCVKKVFGSLE